jgi:hypothetical protein
VIVIVVMVNVQRRGFASMRKKLKSKQKRKFSPKNLDLHALEVGMRKYDGPGCSCCRCGYINLITRPRLFRKKNTYISR